MTGIPAARVDGVSCGASMVKTSVDLPSEGAGCQVRTVLQSTDSLAEMQCYLTSSGAQNSDHFDRRSSDADSISLHLHENTRSKWRVGRVLQSDDSISGCGSAW